MTTTFRQRFVGGERLLGTFIKTPTSHAVEILGGLGFDFVIIDAEHAPFDRESIDVALLAARASGTAGLVRVAEPTPATLLAALDDGAAGVIVPHVSSAAMAGEIVSSCRYRGGTRGFSTSPRAGGYGANSLARHVQEADAQVAVLAMIEDPRALADIDAIVAVPGLDGVFVGRADLAVALGADDVADPAVQAAAERIVGAAAKAGKATCMLVANASEGHAWRARGVSAFVVSSDQGFLRQAALRAREEMAALR